MDDSGESLVTAAVFGASDVLGAPVAVDDAEPESVDESVDVLDEESADESAGSARATPCPDRTAAPTPTVITKPANRLMSCKPLDEG